MPAAAAQFAFRTFGTGVVVDQHVPRAVTVVLPFDADVTVAPRVAVVLPIADDIGVVTVGVPATTAIDVGTKFVPWLASVTTTEPGTVDPI